MPRATQWFSFSAPSLIGVSAVLGGREPTRRLLRSTIAAVAVRISMGSYQMFTIFCDWNMRSCTVMTDTSVEDFTMTVN